MTSHSDHDRLLTSLNDALAAAVRIDNTLAAAMIEECIAAVHREAPHRADHRTAMHLTGSPVGRYRSGQKRTVRFPPNRRPSAPQHCREWPAVAR